jgi:hypothetical protein
MIWRNSYLFSKGCKKTEGKEGEVIGRSKMDPTFFSLPQRAFIAREYHKTLNCREVKWRFEANFGKDGPSSKTVRRLLAKDEEGNLRNAANPPKERPANCPENQRVRGLRALICLALLVTF